MGADLNNIIKTQRLSDDHVQFLVYQILRGMKVNKRKIERVIKNGQSRDTCNIRHKTQNKDIQQP